MMRSVLTLDSVLKQPLKVLKLTQNTKEWFEARRDYYTASETPIIMGISPWVTKGQLAMEKFSDKPPKREQNIATKHGHKFEPIARALYERDYGNEMPPCCIARGKFMASLDGWSRDRRIVLEIKSPYRRKKGDTWRDADKKEIADYYFYQVQHQLMVSGADRAHFYVYDADDDEGIMLVVKPRPTVFVEIIDAWSEFVKRYG